MNDERRTTSPLPTNSPRQSGPFALPKKFVRHLRLFTDLDVRLYVYLLGSLLPGRSGLVSRRGIAEDLSVTELLANRSLLRLMAFGLIRLSADVETDGVQVDLQSDSAGVSPVDSAASRDRLASGIASDLGDEGHVPAYESLVETTHPEVIRRALAATMAVPADRIRKSRSAIFFALIKKYATASTHLGH